MARISYLRIKVFTIMTFTGGAGMSGAKTAPDMPEKADNSKNRATAKRLGVLTGE